MRQIFIVVLLLTSSLFAWLDFPEIAPHDDATCGHLKAAHSLQFPPRPMTRNQAAYDVSFYDLDLQIFPDTELISGTLGVRVTALEDGLDHIDLDLHNAMTVYDVTDLDENELTYTHNDDLLDVGLPQVINTGDEAEFVVFYGGPPESAGFGAFGFSTYGGEDMIWSLSEPYGARNWWPCKDTPTDKPDSMDISIRVPDELIVASNGLLAGTEEVEGWTTYHWEERYPIATYLVSVAIYPYMHYQDWYVTAESDSMPIDFYIYPSSYNQVYYNYNLTKDIIAAFAGRFGEYPFLDEKYGHAEFVWGGGMEHQTMTSMGGYSQHLISHELAHQWWGDMITCGNFHHIWVNEGFATYAQAMWYEMRDNSIESLHEEMWGKRYLGSGTIFVEDTTSVGQIFSSNLSYNKASWVLHMLRHILGDDTFFAGLQEYGDQYRFSHAITEDFRDVMEAVSGMELDAFFQRWIYGEYYPIYSAQSAYADVLEPGLDPLLLGSWIDITIHQHQTSPLFQMPVDICITTTEGVVTFTADVTEQDDEFRYFVEGIPTAVDLDPDNWILRSVQNGSLNDVGTILMGDINGDGATDVLDIVLEVSIIMGSYQPNEMQTWLGDVNMDGNIDILDIVNMVQYIL